MADFLVKSNQSLESAKLLVENNYYASCVNRSYYAYFQYLMHTLFEKLNHDREEFDIAADKNKEGSHVRASNLIIILLEKKLTARKYKWFTTKIKELKQKRVDADYYNVMITLEDSSNCIVWANELIECVKENIN